MTRGTCRPPRDGTKWKGQPLKERLRHLKKVLLVIHPNMKAVIVAIRERLEYCRDGGEPSGVFVFADPGGGKTRLLQHLEILFPTKILSDRTVMSYVWLSVPSICTGLQLANAILKALGDPLWNGKNEVRQTERVVSQLGSSQTVLLAVDNAQDIRERTGPINIQRVGNLLRDVIDRGVVVLIVGTKMAGFVLDANPQLKRRINAVLPLSDYEITVAAGLSRFLRLIEEVDFELPLAEDSNLAEGQMGKALAFASDGKLSHLVNLLGRAIKIAVSEQRESLTLDDLSRAFEQYFPGATVNPFVPGYNDWRRLNQPGESFYAVEDLRDKKVARRA